MGGRDASVDDGLGAAKRAQEPRRQSLLRRSAARASSSRYRAMMPASRSSALDFQTSRIGQIGSFAPARRGSRRNLLRRQRLATSRRRPDCGLTSVSTRAATPVPHRDTSTSTSGSTASAASLCRSSDDPAGPRRRPESRTPHGRCARPMPRRSLAWQPRNVLRPMATPGSRSTPAGRHRRHRLSRRDATAGLNCAVTAHSRGGRVTAKSRPLEPRPR